MKIKKSNKLIKISIFISIIVHIIAISSINHLEIRSFLASKNIIFTNKAESYPRTNKSPSEIISLVLKQKKESKEPLTKAFSSKKEGNILQISNEKAPKAQSSFSYIQNSNENNFFFQTFISKNSFNLIQKEISLSKVDMKSENIKFLNLDCFELTKPNLKKGKISNPKEQILNENISNLEETLLCQNQKTNIRFSKISDIKNLTKNENKNFTPNISQVLDNFSLVNLPNLNDLTTLAYKEFFNIEVCFAPNPNSTGYIFAITLIPKSSIRINKLKQNIFFLVDKSNSIQNDRLTATRHAIASSLPILEKDDKFNILAFDSKLDILSPNSLINDTVSQSRAKGFLRKQSIGSFFSSTNFSTPLFKALDNNTKKDEINIGVLLSNGEGLNKAKNNKTINSWTKLNSGNLSLFTLALDDDKNLSTLEMLSFLNKGKMISSSSNKKIKRKLQKLMKSISYPIAKDIVANTVCLNDGSNIKLYSSNPPNLYLNEPYVIFGTTDKLQDFTLFVQGNSKNSFFNLKKHISFDLAKPADETLQKEFALKQATSCYQKFIADNNPNHLKKAKSILENFDLKPVF